MVIASQYVVAVANRSTRSLLCYTACVADPWHSTCVYCICTIRYVWWRLVFYLAQQNQSGSYVCMCVCYATFDTSSSVVVVSVAVVVAGRLLVERVCVLGKRARRFYKRICICRFCFSSCRHFRSKQWSGEFRTKKNERKVETNETEFSRFFLTILFSFVVLSIFIFWKQPIAYYVQRTTNTRCMDNVEVSLWLDVGRIARTNNTHSAEPKKNKFKSNAIEIKWKWFLVFDSKSQSEFQFQFFFSASKIKSKSMEKNLNLFY